MRDVSIVKKQRNQLKEELERFRQAKEELFPRPLGWSGLSPEDKMKHGYILGTINKLMIQINALEFVLNEDSELRDETQVIYHNSPNFSKESILREAGISTGCKCCRCERERSCC